jgi:hypothetical protein
VRQESGYRILAGKDSFEWGRWHVKMLGNGLHRIVRLHGKSSCEQPRPLGGLQGFCADYCRCGHGLYLMFVALAIICEDAFSESISLIRS